MADEVIRTRFEIDGARAGAVDVDRLNRSISQHTSETNRAGEATTELFRLEGKLGAALQKMGPGAVAAGAAIGGVALAAGAAAAAIGLLAVGLQQLSSRGSEVERSTRVFDRIAGPEVAARLSEVTGGMVRATEAQHAYAQAFRSGLGSDQLLRYFELTAAGASTMGEDITEAVNSAAEALSGMTAPEAREQLQRLEDQFGGMSVQVHSTGEAYTRLENSAGDAFDEFAAGFAESPAMISMLENMNSVVGRGAATWRGYGEALGDVTSRLGRATVAFLTESMGGIAPLNGLIAAFNALGQDGPVAAPPPPPGAAGNKPPVGIPEINNHRGGGRGRAPAPAEEQMQFTLDETEELALEREEEALARINERAEDYNSIIRTQTELAAARVEVEERTNAAIERSIDLEAERAERIGETVDRFSSYANATMTLGNSLAGIFGTLAAREETGSKAAEEYAAVQGGILAAVSYVQAAIEIASAIAAGASYQYGAMAEHIAASVAYIAAGTMALTDLGGSATRPAGGAGAASHYNAATEREQERAEDRAAGTTIYTLGYGSAGLGRELQRAGRGYARSGVDGQMTGAGGWS